MSDSTDAFSPESDNRYGCFVKSVFENSSKATDDGRSLVPRRGRVPVDNLREALWMMALEPLVPRGRLGYTHHLLPKGLRPIVPDDGSGSGFSDSITWSLVMTP